MGLRARVLGSARLYEAVQLLAGVRAVERRIVAITAPLRARPHITVLDLGGGTGRARRLWPASATYVCVDTDIVKLRAYRQSEPEGHAVVGDAAAAPVRDGAADLVLAKFVAHHLADPALGDFLRECARAAGADGRLVFIDPLWVPRRYPGRLLWSIDRGSHPRAEATLRRAVEQYFEIEREERFSIFHSYLLLVARPRMSHP